MMPLRDEMLLLPDSVRRSFMQLGKTAIYQAGDWLPNAADGFTGMRLIEDGEVAVFAVQYAEKVELGRSFKGDFLGVRSMLSPDSLPTIAWCAMEEVTCIEFEQHDVMALFQDDEGFELRQVMERAARERDYDVLMMLHPLFRALPHQQRKELLEGAHPMALLPDEKLLHQHVENDTLYLISRGRVHVLRDEQFVVCRMAGDVIGEISVIEEGRAASADVVACGWCELLAFSGKVIREYSDNYAPFKDKLAELGRSYGF